MRQRQAEVRPLRTPLPPGVPSRSCDLALHTRALPDTGSQHRRLDGCRTPIQGCDTPCTAQTQSPECQERRVQILPRLRVGYCRPGDMGYPFAVAWRLGSLSSLRATYKSHSSAQRLVETGFYSIDCFELLRLLHTHEDGHRATMSVVVGDSRRASWFQ